MTVCYLITSNTTPPLQLLQVLTSAQFSEVKLVSGNGLPLPSAPSSTTSSPILIADDQVLIGVKAIAYYFHLSSSPHRASPNSSNFILSLLTLSESLSKANIPPNSNTLFPQTMGTTTATICLALALQSIQQSTPFSSNTPIINSSLTSSYSSIITSPFYKLAVSSLPTFTYTPPTSTTNMSQNLNFLPLITSIFNSAVLSAYPLSATLGLNPNAVVKCSQMKYGDFQCNSAMELFQKLKALGLAPQKPHDVSKRIIDHVPDWGKEVLRDFSVAGPGFVNARVTKEFLVGRVNETLKVGEGDNNAGKGKGKGKKRKVVVDFSSPNIAKEMHVGHLRSTIIGEATCRILEYNGYDVDRVNHVGDWGTQFGMLIQYLKVEFPDFTTNQPNITDLTTFYKAAKAKFDEDVVFKKISQANVVLLQGGDEECRKIWQILCDISRKEFEKVYKRLNVTVEECGESFYNSKIPPVIELLKNMGLVVSDGGAKCIFVPGGNFAIPLMVQKSDGGFGYDSTDMAALSYRIRELKADRIVYVTDFTQATHFKMCFEAAKMAGWWNETTHSLEHIGFGTVQGEDGKRFKTRSGETVRLVDLLDEAVRRMEETLRERAKEGKLSVPEEDIHDVASKLGYGAVKYFDLSRNPTSNYIFSYDSMLDTKGNTAIYLLFAHARLNSILDKAKAEHGDEGDVEKLKGAGVDIVLESAAERVLCFEILQFQDLMDKIEKNLRADQICSYLYNLSIVFTTFVTECRVLGSTEMKSRLLLCEAAGVTMRKCFKLLAIDCPKRI